jgi:DNA invertase Pin-like site-specific DNA recombinase
MHAESFVAYYRVSTEKQGRSGLGLEAQRTAVAAYVGGRVGTLHAECTEVESGKRNDRPQLVEALRLCRVHGATLVIAKLDRLARNVAFVSGLLESGVDFVATDFPQANRLTIHILAAVAEHEAMLISQRTKAALAAAKERGVRLGGDRGRFAAVRHLGCAASARVRSEAAAKKAADLAPLLCELRQHGRSLKGIAAELTRRGVETPRRGGEWSATQVARVLQRAQLQ